MKAKVLSLKKETLLKTFGHKVAQISKKLPIEVEAIVFDMFELYEKERIEDYA
jgi:hypothetical protein